MSKNRYTTGSEDLNRFRSNLMLLLQNLYIEGLPLAKIQKEYRKFFLEDITPEELFVLMEIKINPDSTEPQKWTAVFNSPSFYEFFKVVKRTESDSDETESNQNQDQNQNQNEVFVVTCKRGRTLVEMKAMAQLAAYDNIELVRYNGLTNTASSHAAALSLCQACWDVVEPDVFEDSGIFAPVSHAQSSHNSRKRKVIQQTVTESIKQKAFERTKSESSNTNANSTPEPETLSNSNEVSTDKTEEMEIEGTELSLQCKERISYEHFEKDGADKPSDSGTERNIPLSSSSMTMSASASSKSVKGNLPLHSPNENEIANFYDVFKKCIAKLKSAGSLLLTTNPTATATVSDEERIESQNRKPGTATRVLINHLGEKRVINYTAVQQTCRGCKEIFLDEDDFALHKSQCKTFRFECEVCKKSFKNQKQLEIHRQYVLCGANHPNLDGKADDSIKD